MKIYKRTNFYELWVLCILRANGKTPSDYSRIEGDGGYKISMTEQEAALIDSIRRGQREDDTYSDVYNYHNEIFYIRVNTNSYHILKDGTEYELPTSRTGAELCKKEYYYGKYGNFTSIITGRTGRNSDLKRADEFLNISRGDAISSLDGNDYKGGNIQNNGIVNSLNDIEKSVPYTENRMIKRLFFDIETSPMVTYTWRIGNKVSLTPDNIIDTWKIICIAYKWEHEDNVKVLRWDEFANEKEMLTDFIKIANRSDEIVGHNSDHFDIKKLRTRCIANGIRTFPKYRSLDTLTKSREYFAFDSNKLDYIAKFLGVGAKVEHEGFNMWVKCLKGDEEALSKMCEYCAGDVIILEDVFHSIQHYIKPNTHVGVHFGEGRYSCPTCGNNGLGGHSIDLIKTDVTEKGFISRVMECTECGHIYNISNKSYMDYGKDKLNENMIRNDKG